MTIRDQRLEAGDLVIVVEQLIPQIVVDDFGHRHIEISVSAKGETVPLDLTYIDPYVVAAELRAAAEELTRMVAREKGYDRQDAEKLLKRERRAEERMKREVQSEIATGTHCDHCGRPVSLIVDGVRYCKRHAEEHGVRPTGKI